MTERDGLHGGRFHYVSPNTYLLGWVVERPMGAARSAYITVDRLGVPRAAGGSCATARDLALVGQLIVKAGTRGGNQVLPRVWLDDMAAGGHSQAWSAGDFAAYIRASDIVAVVHR